AAGDLIVEIFNDNKCTRSIPLKAELRSLKLAELSINAYFCKIESIAAILTSLGSSISKDDVVTIDLEELPNKYDNVSGIIFHREPFSDLKTICFMLTIEEMRLKSRAQATFIDTMSSSHMVLLVKSRNNTRRTTFAPGQLGYNGTTNTTASTPNVTQATGTPISFHTGPTQSVLGLTGPPGFP
nr:hybrid signal transduction histidine kinase M [Tanacetum cinerariifolium]